MSYLLLYTIDHYRQTDVTYLVLCYVTRGKELQRRLCARVREADGDTKERDREQQELQEARDKIFEGKQPDDPDACAAYEKVRYRLVRLVIVVAFRRCIINKYLPRCVKNARSSSSRDSCWTCGWSAGCSRRVTDCAPLPGTWSGGR